MSDSAGRLVPPFRRLLVANRGEIAIRIIRACHDLGVESVAVYSDADRDAGHVHAADTAVRLGPAPASESYLAGDRIISAALETGAEAVHPGYGFLAERAAFASAVEAAGIVFVGPDSRTIAALGDKLAARRIAQSVGVPVVPGTTEPVSIGLPGEVARVVELAAAIGYPLLVKAAAGGGGRGMRRVAGPGQLIAELEAGAREAAASFGDGAVYLEREIRPARHVEVQLLGDASGRVVALGERDCSIQRRHQKLVEEAPAIGLSSDARQRLHAMAIRIGAAAGLRNAATAEFLLDSEGSFWFLEVNVRLQVEHGVTELVSGLDIVQEQLWLAAGFPLSSAALAAAARAGAPDGHAIEVRISLEDPAGAFAPMAGRVGRFSMPAGPGIRVDTALTPGELVPADYDPLVAKLMVHGPDRAAALERLRMALDATEIDGVQTTLPFDRFVSRSRAFQAGELTTGFVDEHWDGPADRRAAVGRALLAAGLAGFDPGTSPEPAAPVPTGPGASPHPGGSAWRATARTEGIRPPVRRATRTR